MNQTNKFDQLTSLLQSKVPYGNLAIQSVPMVESIKLALIEESYPQHDLTHEQVEFLMDGPPYWAFCWASGQVLAKYLIENPHEVVNKSVVDFGSGSGVVAIAAKLAGAKSVVAVDNDPGALLAVEINAELNRVELCLSDNISALPLTKSESVLLIADVFYDADNIPSLNTFLTEYADVIIADSRVKPRDLNGVSMIGNYQSCTVPDLGESIDFNSVNIYR